MLSAVPKVLKAYISLTVLGIYVPKSLRALANFTVGPYFLNLRQQHKQVKENFFFYFILLPGFLSKELLFKYIQVSTCENVSLLFPVLALYISFLVPILSYSFLYSIFLSFTLKILILIFKKY